jgi:hypothetical protein
MTLQSCIAVVVSSLAFLASAHGAVSVKELGDRVRVEIDGKLFTEYIFKDVDRPYCYPVIGPAETPMTRNFPMKDVPGEERDHKHHRSLWYAHGIINGSDFWSENSKNGKTVHEKFTALKSGDHAATLSSQNKWVATNGSVVLTDNRTIRFHADRTIDFEITLQALPDKGFTMGDTKEGSMSLRINESMRVTKPPEGKGKKREKGDGHIVTSEGIRDGATWGTRAAWVDCYGPVEGKVFGVAMFDHPSNPRHPTWWHVRDYGLFAANPWGIHDFEKKPAEKELGNMEVAPGKSISFRYRIIFHEGDELQGKVAERFQEYVKSTPAN